METPVIYDWLIVFFVHEISEDLPQSADMYATIEKTGSGKNNLIFLIRDSISIDDTTQNFCFTLNLSRLEWQSAAGAFKFIPEPDFHFDNTDRKCWQKAFEYIYANFFSERKLLVTYSHGAAFGINRNSDTVIRSGVRRHNIYRTDQHPDAFALTKPASNPVCKALEILWISELAAILRNTLGDASIDVLLMVNCFMQMFDNGCLLADKVDYLVAPQGGMRAHGYDYQQLLECLNKRPAISNRMLVQKIVRDFQQKYVRLGQTDYLKQATMFATHLKYYGMALRGFESFVSSLREEMKGSFEKLRFVRENQVRSVSQFRAYPLIDAGLWIRLVTRQFARVETFRTFGQWFQKLQRKMVVAKYIGSDLIASDKKGPLRYGYSGISLYYPENFGEVREVEVAWCACFDNSISSKFNKRSKWSKFLGAYFQLLQASRPATRLPHSADQSSPTFGGILFPPPPAGIGIGNPSKTKVNTSDPMVDTVDVAPESVS